MRMNEIAEYVWTHSQEIEFGEGDAWDESLFTEKWAKGKPFGPSWKAAKAGWYWFSLDMSYEQLHEVQKPQSLPEKGCNIGLLSHANRDVFKDSLLCAENSGATVIYNGHESNVTGRIRAHFYLSNNSTGALGLRHFALSKKRWKVNYFSSPCFSEIDEVNKMRIESLMNSYSGRCAVESAWRVAHGWPILCKE
jgi:hypothetical protein